MWFPTDTQKGTLINGVWEIDFGPYTQPRVIRSIALTGPASSSVNVYTNTIFRDTTARGDFNRADYPAGIPLPQGSQLRLVWSVGTGTQPTASMDADDGLVNTGPPGQVYSGIFA